MLIHRLIITSFVALTAAATSPLVAQSAAQDTSGTTGTSERVSSVMPIPSTPSIQLVNAPSMDRAQFLAPAPAVTHHDARQLGQTTAALSPSESTGGHNGALMIVGSAGLIVGALIGGNAGTVFMVGGGAVALVGLWNYLK